MPGQWSFFSIGANLLVAGFGLGGFGKILDDNAASLAFWSAMESERLAFERYADTSLLRKRAFSGGKSTDAALSGCPAAGL